MLTFKSLRANWVSYLTLLVGIVIVCFPVYVAFVGSTHDPATIGRGELSLIPGKYGIISFSQAWSGGSTLVATAPIKRMMFNSFVVAMLIGCGKIIVAILTAYALVFFDFPFKNMFFWLIFITLMLPLEARMMASYKIASDLGLINSYAGLSLPHMVSATGTLLFRQVLRSFPRSLIEAAKIDGAGPLRCLWSVVVPGIRPNIAALFIILFVAGWNQYLWPLLITTKPEMQTLTIGIVKMAASGEALVDWNVVMAAALLAMIPPLAIVVFLQRWLLMGLGVMSSK